MKEFMEKIHAYAVNNKKNLFTREEILEVIGREGMHTLLKWDVLEDEGNNQYRLSEYEV